MHHALHIHDILLDIFGHCSPTTSHWDHHRRRSTAVLAALARTCRTFKEAALDVLWSEMVDLTPLPRCIPENCRKCGRRYEFRRRPSEAEWDTLRSYTRRIWHVFGHANPDGWLDNDSLIRICSPSIPDPLFPNLRTLYWQGITMIPAVHIAVPSLTSLRLNLTLDHVPALNDFLDTVAVNCPNVKQYEIHIPHPHPFDEFICNHIRRQKNLETLTCSGVTFNKDTISYLSSTLNHLSIWSIPDISAWMLPSGSAFVFSSLVNLEIRPCSLEQITELLSCTRLPVVVDLNVHFFARPPKETFSSYIKTVANVCSSNSLTIFKSCATPSNVGDEATHRLILDDVRPCMAFVNLRHLHINLQWAVDLTDSDLLALVSTWPHIHTLLINNEWGWRTAGGITLQGLLQLLEKRPSLSVLCIAIHTESFTDPLDGLETALLPPLRPLELDLADSPIQPADVPLIADVFAELRLHFFFSAWNGIRMEEIEGAMEHRKTWAQVFERVTELRGGGSDIGE